MCWRTQDGDTDVPVTVPATPDPGSRPLWPGSPSYSLTSSRDVPAVGRRAADMAAECRDAAGDRRPGGVRAGLDPATAQLLHGEFLDATATAEEGLRIAADTGQTHVTRELASTAAGLAAITGDEEACPGPRGPGAGTVCRGADPGAGGSGLRASDARPGMRPLPVSPGLDAGGNVWARPGATRRCCTPIQYMLRRRSGPAGPILRPGRWPSSRPGWRHRRAVGHRGGRAVCRADRG